MNPFKLNGRANVALSARSVPLSCRLNKHFILQK
jgi:hypothetical protein